VRILGYYVDDYLRDENCWRFAQRKPVEIMDPAPMQTAAMIPAWRERPQA
jgi:hypothetical protein